MMWKRGPCSCNLRTSTSRSNLRAWKVCCAKSTPSSADRPYPWRAVALLCGGGSLLYDIADERRIGNGNGNGYGYGYGYKGGMNRGVSRWEGGDVGTGKVGGCAGGCWKRAGGWSSDSSCADVRACASLAEWPFPDNGNREARRGGLRRAFERTCIIIMATAGNTGWRRPA